MQRAYTHSNRLLKYDRMVKVGIVMLVHVMVVNFHQYGCHRVVTL